MIRVKNNNIRAEENNNKVSCMFHSLAIFNPEEEEKISETFVFKRMKMTSQKIILFGILFIIIYGLPFHQFSITSTSPSPKENNFNSCIEGKERS